jgi:hypothetical protein
MSVILSVGLMDCDGDNGAGPSKGTAPKITTATLPNGTAGTAYSQAIMATGDTPITWGLVSGALPTGLSLFENGIVSGTPTTAGAYSFSVKASNSTGSDSKSFSITITGGSTTPPITPTTQSLDGVWGTSNGSRITVSGSTGVRSAFSPNASGYTQSAIDKGYIKLGDQVWRNLTSTGNLTWSGQVLQINYNTSDPNVATGTSWVNGTLTLSADGQTLSVTGTYLDGTSTSTWTRIQ